MTAAIAALLGSIIGGASALLGALLVAVRQDRRHWATSLAEHAGALTATYMLDRSVLVNARARGFGRPRDDQLAFQARREAQARFFVLPGASQLRDLAERMRVTMDALEAAYDDDDTDRWDRALREQREAVVRFQDRVGAAVDGRGWRQRTGQ